ncbi:MAG: SEC-C metal-binding domain-containing protein, partial [Actinomycetota bacterium]|nr:SEC-C metal-binding domain-containing protein [Actinomycetota bacterium]
MSIDVTPVALKSNDACWCGSGRKYKRCHKASQTPLRPGRVSPTRVVPAGIPRPDYAETGEPSPWPEPLVRPPDVVDAMR